MKQHCQVMQDMEDSKTWSAVISLSQLRSLAWTSWGIVPSQRASGGARALGRPARLAVGVLAAEGEVRKNDYERSEATWH